MTVTIEGNTLTIKAPISEQTSKSGKSLLLATSNGNLVTTASYKGQSVVVGLNAYIKAR